MPPSSTRDAAYTKALSRFRKNLTYVIELTGLTVKDFAAESGIKRSTLQIVLEDREPSLELVLKLSVRHKISLDLLFFSDAPCSSRK